MAKNSNGLLGKLGIVKSPGAAVPHRKNTKDCATVDIVHQRLKLAMKCLSVPLLVTAQRLSPHRFIPVCPER